MTATRVADRFVRTLVAHGIDRVYCVAGESYLYALDALAESPIDVVTCRHEGSAAFAALADGKLTGRPGVCLVNRGPGASNAAIAVHAASQDSAPLLLVVGQVPRAEIGRGGFQEMDYDRAFGDQAKKVYDLLDGHRTAETTAGAIRACVEGTPGPVVLVIPEDVFAESIPEPSATAPPTGAEPYCGGGVDGPAAEAVLDELAAARRPLLLAGGLLAAPADGRRALRRAAERWAVPVVTSNKHQDLLDNRHPLYVGHLHLATQGWQRDRVASADLLLAVGSRLDTVTTQSGALLAPGQRVVQVYPGAAAGGDRVRAAIRLRCSPTAFLELMADDPRHDRTAARDERQTWAESLRAGEEHQSRWTSPGDAADGVPFGSAVAAVGALADNDAVVTLDAGNFSSWVHRYHRFHQNGRLLALGCGAMGFGVPSGLAAALRYPGRQVVTFVGDGGFLMTGTDLATAVDRRVRLVIIVADNGSYGTIRQHQERTFPGRVVATDLANPDFVALARAFGARGLAVREERDLVPALEAAMASDGPVVVAVRTSLAWISAYQRIDISRAPAPSAAAQEALHVDRPA